MVLNKGGGPDTMSLWASSVGRRQVLAHPALIGAAAALSTALPAGAAGRVPADQAPAYYRFKLGDAELTLVSDGPILSGDPKVTFRGAPKEEIDRVLRESFLPTDKLVFEQNILVLRNGGKTVIFDTGMGPSKAFGPDAGHLLPNLAAAGFSPEGIDAVVLSHGHADHVNGLVMADGSRTFPNAQIYIDQTEFEFWTSAERTGPGRKVLYEHAARSLLPNRDRLQFIREGQEFLPGIQAVPTPGHSPGHLMFMIQSGGDTLSYIADVGRHHILNVEMPRLQFIGDTDLEQCVASRLRAFDMLVSNRIPVISYHYPWPGIGHLATWGDRYRYYPSAMQMSG